jgi:type IV pilus assembly protein PilA
MNKMLKKRLFGNKGFSLIELIIVIAIMAALIAILAPQYLKYVEKSRTSADETTANEILTAAKVSQTDPDNDPTTTALVVTWASTGVITYTGSTDAVAAFQDAIGVASTGTIARKSSTHDSDIFSVSVAADGTVTADDPSANDWGTT